MPDFTSGTAILLMAATFGYLLGSVPFGLVMARAFGLGDLRKIGSGNIGATNVLRTGHKPAAFLTLVLDSGKGAIAVLLTRAIAGEDAVQVAALAAFLGHCFPIWLQFKGGKGVATFLGTVLALAWPVGLAACATWVVIAVLFRYSSLAALVAAGMSPVWAAFQHHGEIFFLCIALALLIYGRHWANIQRLRAGTESKIGRKS